MKKIAIFDVCDTLYNVNTTFSFLDYFFHKNNKYAFFRKISRLFLIKVANYLVLKLLGKDLIRICGTFFLKNHEKDEIKKFSKIFVSEILDKQIKKDIATKLKYFKEQDYYIVLMSGSYDFIIKEVANYFNVSTFFASKLEIVDKFYIGKFKNDILMDKYNLFNKNFQSYEKLIVVSNNKSDLKLMNLADKAYAVCNKKSDLKFWNNHTNIECVRSF
ncbi:MAG: hypothetical protein CBC25_07675 [Pelagibacteraceae bacterium TMED65]|nr:MAG: hypothetical protein CBC25_07675 [Pelagibacteraceae bacterium TMED65]|tara:strand:- start:5305 stop:5955 length:651 start_codon:yes stop_codon:yes gene_type:complete